jgi:hypothetical protein
MRAATKLMMAGGAAVGGAALWWRKNPSACPYGQRFWVEAPHPFITRDRLREILSPQPGEELLEIGAGTGYYTLDLARWVAPAGTIEIFDLQREMLDHTMRRGGHRERLAHPGRCPVPALRGRLVRRRGADHGPG